MPHKVVVADVLDKVRSLVSSIGSPNEAEESAAFVLASRYLQTSGRRERCLHEE
jgi:hypothetical protein